MANEEPAFLTPGIEVSAKYRGAFCEAKIKKVDKNVKCKVTLKDDGKVMVVQDEDIIGSLRVGATVEVKRPDCAQNVEGVVNRINDLSIYTVVFDDGDENTLRRTKLCLKGDRHFMKSETLDDLPLTHPERFCSPVVRKSYKSKAQSIATCSEYESESDSSNVDSETGAGKRIYSNHLQQDLVGQVLCVDFEERNKRTITVPVLVVLPSADDIQLPTRHCLLVKSFKDNKFLTTVIANTKEFSQEIVSKNKDKALKLAFDRAQNFIDRKELPASWDKMELLGFSSEDSSESDDDEPDEKRDRFVAELYKFMDYRGTPINKAPNLGGFDLNLSRLFRIVQTMGGYNRVTNQMKWHVIHSKMNLPSSAAVVSSNIKQAYKKYLHAFEDFNRKLGCTMVMSSRSRASSNRSLVSFRERERDQTPKSVRSRRAGSVKEDDKIKGAEPELEKADKPSLMEKADPKLPMLPNKPGQMKPKISKKEVLKKENLDTDSVSSDSIPKTPVSLKNTEGTKSSIDGSFKQQKDTDKMTKSSYSAVKEEVTRMTRGESSKTKEPNEKTMTSKDDKSTEKCRMMTLKGEGKEFARTKVEVEKLTSSEKTDSEKEEKQKGSRRQLRRAVLHVTNTSEDLEEEEEGAKSSNYEIKVWDEADIQLNSLTNNETKIDNDDDDFIKSCAGRQLANLEDIYAVGTRLDVRYGKGKVQKIYEAKVLERKVEAGFARYFVHYNGWNSRYDEWINKEAVVNVLEEPALEMPKLRSNLTPSIKTPFGLVSKKIHQTTSMINKDKNKSSMNIRRTRSNSIDQVKLKPKMTAKMKGGHIMKSRVAETGSSSNDSNSNTSSSASLSEVEEKEDVVTEPPMGLTSENLVSEAEEKNLEEDDSNSYHSCSPIGTLEMPVIYTSEEDEPEKNNVMDDENIVNESTCMLSSESKTFSQNIDVPNKITASSDREAQNSTEKYYCFKSLDLLEVNAEIEQSENSLTYDEKMQTTLKTVQPVDELNKSAEVNLPLKEVETIHLPELMCVTAKVCSIQNITNDEMVSTEVPKIDKDTKPDRPSLPPSTVEISVITCPPKTRRKKKQTSSDSTTRLDVALSSHSLDLMKREALDDCEKGIRRQRRRKFSYSSSGHVTEEMSKSSAAENVGGPEESDAQFSFRREGDLAAFGEMADTESAGSTLKKRRKVASTFVNELTSPENNSSLRKAKGLKRDQTLDMIEGSDKWQFHFEIHNKATDDDLPPLLSTDIPSLAVNSECEMPELGDEKSNVVMLDVESKPSSSISQDDRTREGASLLSEFAAELNKTTVFNNSPPESSAENSPSALTAQDEGSSPSQEEQTSTKSEQEANMEVEAYMGGRLEMSICGDSQSGYEFSTASSDSITSSHSSIHGFDNEMPSTSVVCEKRKFENDDRLEMVVVNHHRKRKREKLNETDKTSHKNDLNDSDQDSNTSKNISQNSSSSPVKSTQCSSSQRSSHHLHRPTKYNFIDLEEGKYLEGEDRITFLTNKIQDLRAAYMQLKAEVASIDRRRRRHRVKEKEVVQLSAVCNLSSSTTVTSSSST